MPEIRLKATTQVSFFGDYLYEQVIPKHYFLRLLREIVEILSVVDEAILFCFRRNRNFSSNGLVYL